MSAQAVSTARSSSFYTAMRIMPSFKRDAMYEIYHFCRSVDNIADSEKDFTQDRLIALEQWRKDIGFIYAGKTPPVLYGLANAITGFGLKQEDFLAVIDGMEMDVCGPIQAPDAVTLALYCERVACAVGRLCVRVFGLPGREGLDLAYHLGMALQLTNILRDIDEDGVLGRLYLPRELLEEAGITKSIPPQVLADPAIGGVCLRLAWQASGHFNEADKIMKRCDPAQVRTPRIMSQAYRAIHAALLERGFAYPRRMIRLNKAKLGMILIKSMLF